jgi:glucose/arabinose dehydrogenase
VRFAPNGEVFAIDKDGQIFDFPSLAEPNNETIVADLKEEVMNYEDRGMLGLAVDPQYPVRPYIYVLYAYDAPPGQTAPVWPKKECPGPPLAPGPGAGPEFGAPGDGCVITGRLSRITVDPTNHLMVGKEQPLISQDWCQQFTSHSIGDLQFGPEGALYVSGGAGGAFNVPDWGQYGGTLPDEEHPITPRNPCGDPNETSPGPGEAGVTKEELPTAEGGVLRSQSFQRPSSQPATLGGTIARVSPETGQPLPDNPNIAAPDLNRQRIVAYGLRQPFRFTFRPGGGEEIWEGDVGENKWEEINRDPNPLTAPSRNFGWPCFEGNSEAEEYGEKYREANLCKKLYLGGISDSETAPYYTYNHGEAVLPGDKCPYFKPSEPIGEAGSSTSGLAFVHGGPWPAAWNGALLFADFTRDCIWAMMSGENGLPDNKAIKSVESLSEGGGEVCEFTAALSGCAVDLELGPEGDIYYTDISGGFIRRLSYQGYPVAVLGVGGAFAHVLAPFTFTGEKSSSPHPGATTYHWDFGDETSANTANASHTYARAGVYTATLMVTDTTEGTHDSSSVKVTVLEPEPPAKKEELLMPPIVGTTQTNPLPTPRTTLTAVGLTPSRFHAARTETLRKTTGKGKSAIGAILRFSLSQKGSVTLTFARSVKGGYKSITVHGVVSVCSGRGHRRKCRAPKSNHITAPAGAGAHSIVLSGWVGGVPLPPGSYSVKVQALGANGTTSAPVTIRFTVLAPAKH